MTVQEQALKSKAVAHEIYYQNPICRLCKQLAETVGHTIRGRRKLAETKGACTLDGLTTDELRTDANG